VPKFYVYEVYEETRYRYCVHEVEAESQEQAIELAEEEGAWDPQTLGDETYSHSGYAATAVEPPTYDERDAMLNRAFDDWDARDNESLDESIAKISEANEQ
jgi:hypothetical protein